MIRGGFGRDGGVGGQDVGGDENVVETLAGVAGVVGVARLNAQQIKHGLEASILYYLNFGGGGFGVEIAHDDGIRPFPPIVHDSLGLHGAFQAAIRLVVKMGVEYIQRIAIARIYFRPDEAAAQEQGAWRQ